MWGRARATTAVIWLVLSACDGEGPQELAISRNQAPEAACTLSQIGARPSIDRGVFDLSIGDRAAYIMTPVVENPGPEDIVVVAARVDVVQNTDEEVLALRFTCTDGGCGEWDLALCDGEDDPACPVVPARGRASFPAPVLPRVVTAYFQSMMDRAVGEGRIPPAFFLTTSVQLVGYVGGRGIVGPAHAYDIELCLGCLVEFPPGSDNPSLPGPDCCGPGPAAETCFPGQDGPIDCRSCVASLPEICNLGRPSCRF